MSDSSVRHQSPGSAPRVRSEARRVTFFEDRVEVQRRARAQVPAGVTYLEVEGVSALIDDPSLVAGVKGPDARVLAAKVRRQVVLVAQLGEGELAAASADALRARAAREGAERALERARAGQARVAALLLSWMQAVSKVPRGGEGGAARWLGAYRALDAEAARALQEVHQLQGRLKEAQEDEARAELRLREGQQKSPQQQTLVELQVEARGAAGAEVEVELSYRCPCALWRPEHVAQLTVEGKGAELRLLTYAAVWQATGEQWEGVECRFSTARPAQAASPPALSDDWLTLRRKTEQEQRTVVVETREQAIQAAGLARGGRQMEEMPGVEDGGEPLWLKAARPVTLPSDGRPLRVEIQEVRLPAQVDVVAFPERAEAAHLRATATLTGATPLLAGPVRVIRGGELMGHGRVGFVARGEPFELGFGVDDGVRVRRQVQDERRDVPVLGTQKITRTVKLYLSNLGGAPQKLGVVERVPVSEIEEVKVELQDAGGGRLEGKDGYLRFQVELSPRAHKTLTYSYLIEAAAKVVLPF